MLPSDPFRLRPYQQDAVARICDELSSRRSTLLVLATGIGKTVVIADVIRRHTGRVLVLAHRSELVAQAARTIHRHTGRTVDIEQASQRWSGADVIVASTQTLIRQARRERLARDFAPSLVVVDEAHHYTSRTWRQVATSFDDARVLGVTATPQRADGVALGSVFESVAYRLDLADAIRDGWLVPLRAAGVMVDAVDLDDVGVTAGDFRRGRLDEAMMRSVEVVVDVTRRHYLDRHAIAFGPGKLTAKLIAERLNAVIRDRYAEVITEENDPRERRSIIAACHQGEVMCLSNCMVATEGFDWPAASVMLCARPTKSQGLYLQMLGRITRTLPGVLDGLEDASSEARRDAISKSAKPFAVVVDFVGVTRKHSVVQAVDVLSGKDPSDEAVQRAKKQLLDGAGDQMDVADVIQQAEQEILEEARRMRSRVVAEITEHDMDLDPVSDPVLGVALPQFRDVEPPTRRQVAALEAFGVPERQIPKDKRAAAKMLSTLMMRKKKGLATYKQLRLLKRYGWTNPNISKRRASAAIDYLARHKWGRARSFSPHALREILTGPSNRVQSQSVTP